MENKDLVFLIRDLRFKKKLSQAYLSDYLKVDRSTYNKIENNERRLTAVELIKLEKLFGERFWNHDSSKNNLAVDNN